VRQDKSTLKAACGLLCLLFVVVAVCPAIAPFLVLRCSIRMVASGISQAVTEMDCDVRELDGTSPVQIADWQCAAASHRLAQHAGFAGRGQPGTVFLFYRGRTQSAACWP
jgi:hypothetical protein